MKNKKYNLSILIFLVFLLVGCGNIESNEKEEVEFEQIENDEFAIDDNLLHRIYETGIKAPKNSKLIIDELDLDLNEDENIKIYVVDIENSISEELGTYSAGQHVSCIIGTEGIYALIGVVTEGKEIDLTPQITIQTQVKEDPNVFLN